MLWAQSATKDYIRAEHKLHSIPKLFISQVVIPQVMFLEPIYIPRALNTGTCIRQGDLFYSAGLHRNHVLATANTGEIGKGFGKNAGKWTRSVEISKEEIPGSKRSMCGYILTYLGCQGRIFKHCVLKRWDFNFCVRGSPLRGSGMIKNETCNYRQKLK